MKTLDIWTCLHHPLNQAGGPRPLSLKTLPMGRFCRFCQSERPLGAMNCRQVGRIGTICTPYLSRTPDPHIPTDRPILPIWEALNCRQISTRPSTIEKKRFNGQDYSESIGRVIIESFTSNIHRCSLKSARISLTKVYISGKLRFVSFQKYILL